MVLAALRRVLPEPLRVSAAVALLELRIAARTAGQPRRLAALDGPLRVNLGCGADVRPGWLNLDLDLAAPRGVRDVDGALVATHDLRRGVPLREGSCSLIYTSHFLEHLTPGQALRVLGDCRAALRADGRLRVAVPDLGRIAAAYAAGDREFLEPLRRHVDEQGLGTGGRASIGDAIDYAAHQAGEHKQVYDAERLTAQLRAAGFGSVEAGEFDPEVDVDDELRRLYSVYAWGKP